MQKPTTLEQILAWMPFPYYGEKAAKKVAFHKTHRDSLFQEHTPPFMEIQTAIEIGKMRAVAYFGGPSCYLVYKIMENTFDIIFYILYQ